MLNNSTSTLIEVVKVLVPYALQYGPFLFALLFNVVLVQWAYRMYRSANTRSDPPAPQDEINTYKFYFVGVACFGMALVIASVIWWWNHPPFTYVFRGVIHNLPEYVELVSGELYFRKQYMEKINPDLPQLYDSHFVALLDKPFSGQESFDFWYAKDKEHGGTQHELGVGYSDVDKPRFRIIYDAEQDRYCLIPKEQQLNSCPTAIRAFDLISSAYAAQIRANPGQTHLAQGLTSNVASLEALETPSSRVSQKIAALDRLIEMPDDRVLAYLGTFSPPEPRVLMMLDLTRHSDVELASKAKRIVQGHDVNGVVADKLLSGDPLMRQAAEQILFRIERQRALAILDEVEEALTKGSKRLSKNEMAKLRTSVKSAKHPKLIITTGTSDGDRYYMRATWDRGKENKAVSTCLAQSIYPLLMLRQSQDEYARQIMGYNGSYWIYAREKFQILRIAEEAEKCGAAATFVSGYSLYG